MSEKSVFREAWSPERTHRTELCDTSGVLTGAMALNLKDRDDKGHDTMKKNS